MTDLVLLHGALGASRQLDPLAEALRSRFRVHQLDFEGHATAAYRSRPYRMAHFVENALELLDAQRIQRAQFFGYSMGGYVAVHLASLHPERVERVATLGTKYLWDPETAKRESSRLDPDVIRAKVPRFAEMLAARHEGAGGWVNVLARTAELLRDLGDRPVLTEDVLAAVEAPVSIIVGDKDNTVTVDECSVVSRALPSGSLVILPDTPHPIEQVDLAVLLPVLQKFFR